MGFGKTFTRAIVREVGRNYGKAISNSLLGDKHSTPIRVVTLGSSSAPRNYKHKLDKICRTWEVKGPTATFNVAQNICYSFFDLVDEAEKDNFVSLSETHQLMNAFADAHKQMIRICQALEDLGKKDLSEKADELDNRMMEFFVELNKDFKLPPEPKGLFKSKEKKNWAYAKSLKDNIEVWVKDYKSA